MTRDAEVDLTENGHPRVRFQDGSQVTYRLQTSTPNSPGIAITIRTSGLGLARFQRIHFIRKSSE
jgi:hypothetical protein